MTVGIGLALLASRLYGVADKPSGPDGDLLVSDDVVMAVQSLSMRLGVPDATNLTGYAWPVRINTELGDQWTIQIGTISAALDGRDQTVGSWTNGEVYRRHMAGEFLNRPFVIRSEADARRRGIALAAMLGVRIPGGKWSVSLRREFGSNPKRSYVYVRLANEGTSKFLNMTIDAVEGRLLGYETNQGPTLQMLFNLAGKQLIGGLVTARQIRSKKLAALEKQQQRKLWARIAKDRKAALEMQARYHDLQFK